MAQAQVAAEPQVMGIRARVLVIGVVISFAALAAAALLLKGDTHAPRAAPKQAGVLRTVGVFDSFRRADSRSSLGKADNGTGWQPATATWGIQGNAAYVVKAAPARSIVHADMGSTDGFVQVTLAKVQPGAGLVVRYANPRNYLAIVAVPKYATWNVEQVTDGTAKRIGNLGIASVKDGAVISVALDGSSVQVAINSQRRVTFTVPAVRGATGAGLVAYGSQAGAARWHDFAATPRAPASLPPVPSTAAANTTTPEPPPTTVAPRSK